MMVKVVGLGLVVLTMGLILAAAGTAAKSEDTSIALVNGILIDGTGSEPIPEAIVVIEGNLIRACGLMGEVDIPKNARVIDIQGGAILPGFINAHVHGAYDGERLLAWAQDGVTTVRDLSSGAMKDPFVVRDRLLLDKSIARLVAAGPMVTTVGGYGSMSIVSPEDAADKVRRLADEGAELIKIGIEDNLQGRTFPLLSPEEIRTIVDVAHSRGLRVSAHISRTRHLQMALEAGVDDVAHMVIDYLPNDIIGEMVKRGVHWTPTMELWEGVSRMHGLTWNRVAAHNLKRFVDAGGKVALGTDYGGYTIEFDLGMPMTEIRLMEAAGMTPMQIIVSATKNAAWTCGLEKSLGTIEPGKVADVIVAPGNPLEDLGVLDDLDIVIHNGIVIKERR